MPRVFARQVRSELDVQFSSGGRSHDPRAAPCGATSSTFRLTTSHPRSLLSIATLNIAKSRSRPSTWSLVRIDQTFFVWSGGFDPIILSVPRGSRSDFCVAIELGFHAHLLCYRGWSACTLVAAPRIHVWSRSFPVLPARQGEPEGSRFDPVWTRAICLLSCRKKCSSTEELGFLSP